MCQRAKSREACAIKCHLTNTIRSRERFPAYCLFAGESQQSSDTSGPLVSTFKSVGNFIKLQLVKQTGEWSLKMMSTRPYTLKVIGETSAVGEGDISHFDSKIVFLVWMLTHIVLPFVGGFFLCREAFFFF